MTALAISPNGVYRPTLSNLMEEWFGNDFQSANNTSLPSSNLIEYDDHYTIELAVPGRQKSDFEIKLDNQLLTINSVESRTEKNQKSKYHLHEFRHFEFSRTFSLVETIDTEQITAKCQDGILTIHLPKKDEAKKLPPRSIKIK